MRLATKDVIVNTKEGNKLVKAGDVVEEAIPAGEKIDFLEQVKGVKPKKYTSVWAGGRPLKMVVGEIEKVISVNRREHSMGDMDAVLPKGILARRKKLILDRMRQERG